MLRGPRRYSAGAIRRAVRQLIDDPLPRTRAQEIAAWSREHDGAAAAAALVERMGDAGRPT